MMSCILVFYLAVFGTLPQATDPDTLYAQREQIVSARAAAAIWAERLKANPRDFEAAWKLARARYWLGSHAPEGERKRFLEGGVSAGEAAAESFGLRQGLKHRGAIREALLKVLNLDPAFQQGSADRALGRWYAKVPGLFGGDRRKAEQHLRQSLTYNANSISSRFFLAETLLDLDRKAEAMAELARILETAPDPAWVPEDRECKQKAERLLTTLKQKR
jgi:tetratricopeptide (TPR) repeat protein